jgi:hypothetical protein
LSTLGTLFVGLVFVEVSFAGTLWEVSGQDPEFGKYRGHVLVEPSSNCPELIEVQSSNALATDLEGCDFFVQRVVEFDNPHPVVAQSPSLNAISYPPLRVEKRIQWVLEGQAKFQPETQSLRVSFPLNPLVEDKIDLILAPSRRTWSVVKPNSWAALENEKLSDPMQTQESFTKLNLLQLNSIQRPQLPDSLIRILAGKFYKDPFVKSFENQKLFQEKVHFEIKDPTNFEFYRSQHQVLRIVNHPLNDNEIRLEYFKFQAYSITLAEKAASFERQVASRDLDSWGLISIPVLNSQGQLIGREADYDAALWTGQYILSQSLRYKITGEEDALRNIDRSVRGLLLLVDVSPDPREFARSLRPAHQKAFEKNDGWTAGVGKFADLEYNIHGNNDMIRGVIMGLAFGGELLPSPQMKLAIVARLRQLLTKSRIVQKNLTHQLAAAGGIYIITKDPKDLQAYLSILENLENGSFDDLRWPKNIGGISDWSGNNLGLVKDILRLHIAKVAGAQNEIEAVLSGSLGDWKELKHFRIAPHTFFLAGESSIGNAISAESREAALWNLREFPPQKIQGPGGFDHSKDPGFVLSPYPSQPWKFLDSNRPAFAGYQSLVSYPFYSSGALTSLWVWRESPFQMEGSSSTNCSSSGADYLYAYWLGRSSGVLSATD